MPRNIDGVAIDPTELNRSDGFSPGTMIVTRVPGIDLERTGAPPLGDLARSLDARSPMVIIDADTGERHPFWVELDPGATTDEDRALMLRPAVSFEEGHRYVVALRDLRDGAGATIPANPVFAAYRDAIPTDVPHVEARRPPWSRSSRPSPTPGSSATTSTSPGTSPSPASATCPSASCTSGTTRSVTSALQRRRSPSPASSADA
jgi:hypothetical protein